MVSASSFGKTDMTTTESDQELTIYSIIRKTARTFYFQDYANSLTNNSRLVSCWETLYSRFCLAFFSYTMPLIGLLRLL